MENKIIIHNPNRLPVVSYKKLVDFQGKLKEVSKENIEKIIKSILNNGIFVPKFVWLNDEKYYIIDGHTTKLALGELEKRGYNIPEIPYVEIKANNRSEAKKKLLVINSHYGRMTDEGLYEFLETDGLKIDDLKDEIDFSDINMDKFMDSFYNDLETEGDDDIPEEIEPITKLGDIIELGQHRLLCGDAKIRANINKLMNDKKPDIIFTDPPYGINVVGKSNTIGGAGTINGKRVEPNKFKKVHGDDETFNFEIIKGLAPFYLLFGANYYCTELPFIGQWIVWNKKRGKGLSFSDCELIWTSGTGKRIKMFDCLWDGLRKEGEKGIRCHPTQKPIKLLKQLLIEYSKKDNLILDPFIGSGSTLISCEKTSRICYGMEIDEHYCDVIIERYRQYCKANNLKRIIKRNGEELKF